MCVYIYIYIYLFIYRHVCICASLFCSAPPGLSGTGPRRACSRSYHNANNSGITINILLLIVSITITIIC